MNVFIGWSGEISKGIAITLRDWLPNVIQAIDPWVSPEDIAKGARWSADIAKQLEAAKVGIVCVTPENYKSPWLNFEAGAISKTVGDSYVCPYLFNMTETDLKGPLTQFQATTATKDDTKKLTLTLNDALKENKVNDDRLKKTFERWWPDLKKTLDEIKKLEQPERPKRNDKEILEEILDLVRQVNRDISIPRIDYTFAPDSNTGMYGLGQSGFLSEQSLPIQITSKECSRCGSDNIKEIHLGGLIYDKPSASLELGYHDFECQNCGHQFRCLTK